MSTVKTITSGAQILVTPVVLQLFDSSDLVHEIGTSTNPLIFSGAVAGLTTQHPDNPFLLYNDKNGIYQSVDAQNISLQVLSMAIVDELIAVSDGTSNQIHSIAYAPILNQTNAVVSLRVNAVRWTEVSSFIGQSNTATVFIVNYTTGAISFGNNVNGAIPTNGQNIYVTYSPDTTTYGVEAMSEGWLGVQSVDVDAHPRTLLLDPCVVVDTLHVQVGHTPLINTGAISGIYLPNDPNRLGTNYFIGGSYNDASGLIALGTALPLNTAIALVDYIYTIKSDAETGYTQLSIGVIHTLINSIPDTCAKKLNLQVVIPSGASPTNGVNVKFRLRITYTEF